MVAYSESYLEEVVETQGKLFDFVSSNFEEYDTKDFISFYMKSLTREFIDNCYAYVNTMSYKELWQYFIKTDHYNLKKGSSLNGFLPDWIGRFYSYYQWYYNIPSKLVLEKIPLEFLIKAYSGLHDLDLKIAVEKVGRL